MSSSSTRTLKATNLDFKYKNTYPDFLAFLTLSCQPNTNRSPAKTQTQTQQQISLVNQTQKKRKKKKRKKKHIPKNKQENKHKHKPINPSSTTTQQSKHKITTIRDLKPYDPKLNSNQ